ncbi:hypothetical protein GJ496_004883 [Pomphorhynchus laevis]|nr:hypothetical protein GJ496_004883 [Pomphorhynchus laevis]
MSIGEYQIDGQVTYILKQHQDILVHISKYCKHSAADNKSECLLQQMMNHIETLNPFLMEMGIFAPFYDYSSTKTFNGYRTLIECYANSLKCFFTSLKSARHLVKNMVLPGYKCLNPLSYECQHWYDHIREMSLLIIMACSMHKLSDKFMKCVMNTKSFFGTPIGFQYSEMLKEAFVLLTSTMSVYPEYSKSIFDEFTIQTLMKKSVKYILNPNQRIDKAHTSYLNATVGFSKTLFGLSNVKLIDYVARYQQQTVALNTFYTLPSLAIYISPNNRSKSCKISHIRLEKGQPVRVKLISKYIMQETLGALNINKSSMPSDMLYSTSPPKTIMFHIHGGGFIAEWSSTHETYLREWTDAFSIPILSVDYSESPKEVFPTPVLQCFYAYIWMLEEKPMGWTGDNIVFVGDSAGGNIVTAVLLKAIDEGIRVPDQLFLFYPALNITSDLSPSRLVGLIDPVLNFHVMLACLKAYFGLISANNEGQTVLRKLTEDYNSQLLFDLHKIAYETSSNNFLASPVYASDEHLAKFPNTMFFVSSVDPLLDDSISMAKRLNNLGVDVHLEVFKDIPHGFLQIKPNKPCTAASKQCLQLMQQTIFNLTAYVEL